MSAADRIFSLLLKAYPKEFRAEYGQEMTCVGVFVLTGVAAPRLSVVAMMLGTAFPIAVLVFVRIRRGSAALQR